MLGISRGTLRTALRRLQDSGEIVRRQGSGTFVGRVSMPGQLDERLELLEPYSSLARRRGIELSAADVRIEQRAVGREVGELLGLEPAALVTAVFRVLLAGESPAAVMYDIVAPAVALPPLPRLQRRLEKGDMVLDILIARGVQVAFARTRVCPYLVTPREQVGKALAVRRTTAALELQEIIYAGASEPVAYSRDLFVPGALDVNVMRSLGRASLRPITPLGGARRRARAAPATR
jgi:GntR family transcriptional regulator